MTSTAITDILAVSASRRELLHRSGLAAGALTFGGLLGPAFDMRAARAQDEFNDTSAFTDELDRIGSLDYATGIVQVDLDALAEIVARYRGPGEVELAVETYRRHAELGFAVTGSPEEVQAGTGTCLPWAAVEYLVGEGQRALPPEAQYAIVADLGILRAESPEEIFKIITNRFPNVPRELGEDVGLGGTLAMSSAGSGMARLQFGSWLTILFNILKQLADAYKLPAKPRRGIVACLQSSMVFTTWWGIRVCFDPDCTREMIEYLRAGVAAPSSGQVISALVAVGFSWWVGAIIAAVLVVFIASGYLIANALESALTVTPNRGACVDLSWWLWNFGFPFSGARPWY